MTETHEQQRDRQRLENKRWGAIMGGFMATGLSLAAVNPALHMPAWLLFTFMIGYWPIAIVYRGHIHERLMEWRFRRAWKHR